MNVSEIADAVKGRLEGDPAADITGISGIRDAQQGDLSFVANPRYLKFISSTGASAVLVPEDADIPDAPCALIYCGNPSLSFAKISGCFKKRDRYEQKGIHPQACVGENCSINDSASIGACSVIGDNVKIGSNTVIMPLVYIGNGTVIGSDCRIYPHVSVYEDCRIGDRVTVHSGTVIGSDGYGYETDRQAHVKIPQLGTVEIGDDVELGACVTVDRARFGSTVIGEGTKVDNLVQIAHNVTIGSNSLIVAQTGISGSTKIGSSVIMAGRSGTFGHISIGDRAVLTACSVASKDIPSQATVSGFPARPSDEYRKSEAIRLKLPDMMRRVRELEKKVETLEEKTEDN